jgi:hypothetical protein
MLFKVMTTVKTSVVVKQLTPSGTLAPKTIMIPPREILEVYGYYTNNQETRFVAWNEQISATFFTVAVSDCRPAF